MHRLASASHQNGARHKQFFWGQDAQKNEENAQGWIAKVIVGIIVLIFRFDRLGRSISSSQQRTDALLR